MHELRTHTQTQSYSIHCLLCVSVHTEHIFYRVKRVVLRKARLQHSTSYDELFKNQIINAGKQAIQYER